MEAVILLRNPTTAAVWFIGDRGEASVFKDMDEAVAFAEDNNLCQAWPYQIVELDEL